MTFKRQKHQGRWQVTVKNPDFSAGSGIRLVFTRKGVEVFGHYDHFVGIGDVLVLTWAELEQIRQEVWNGQATEAGAVS